MPVLVLMILFNKVPGINRGRDVRLYVYSRQVIKDLSGWRDYVRIWPQHWHRQWETSSHPSPNNANKESIGSGPTILASQRKVSPDKLYHHSREETSWQCLSNPFLLASM